MSFGRNSFFPSSTKAVMNSNFLYKQGFPFRCSWLEIPHLAYVNTILLQNQKRSLESQGLTRSAGIPQPVHVIKQYALVLKTGQEQEREPV